VIRPFGARAASSRAPLFAVLVLLVPPAVAASVQTPASEAALLAGSEISVTESGGIAGRVHAVKLTASSGKVSVEYRAREVPPNTPAFTGTLATERYIALWRDLEAANVWEVQSRKPSRGADLIQTELRIRLGESSRLISWDDGGAVAPQIRRLVEVARRALAAGRESAFSR
jgi:hypothetical protein